ncbi:MAG: hypothetical protein NUV46_02435 [Nanoarchaeota archaeon]|nr:hypothetical protein [Nanoarchaeota archaeon]
MKRNVLLVDDESKWVKLMSSGVSRRGFNPVEFTDFYGALDYVVLQAGSIYACFVDMKPIPKVPEECFITDVERELLQAPEKLFYEAKSKGAVERFYFISAHKSEYDEAVLQRTGAGFIEKVRLNQRIAEVLTD